MTFRELQEALRIFDLGERATLRQIKSRHRDLARAHHPDRGETADPERMRQVNTAYRILLEYCEGYRFSFSEEEFFEQRPDERLRRQFGWDPVWGGREE